MKFIVALIVLAAIASAEITSVELKSAAVDAAINTCLAVSSETPVNSPKWTREFIYPIEVCAMFTGNSKACKVGEAAAITPSKITLQLKDGATPITTMDGQFTLADHVVGPKLYCYTFNACDILAKLTAANYAKELSDITLVGKVEVTGAEKEETGSNPNLKAILRASGFNVPEKAAEQEFKNLFGNPFSVIRKSTFCDDAYDCITEMSNTKLSATVKNMVLAKGAKRPTCQDTATAEETKLHMTTFARNDGEVCSWNGVNGDCVTTLTINDEDHTTTTTTSSTTTTSEGDSTPSPSGAINRDTFTLVNALAFISVVAITA